MRSDQTATPATIVGTRSVLPWRRRASYSVARHRRVPLGQIAAIITGNALLITGARHRRLRLTPHHTSEPWRTNSAPRLVTSAHATVTPTT